MEKISRRAFVKRSGAVTLGSVLGLGMLPSLTRKLHAADSSRVAITGVNLNWTSGSMSSVTPYMGGELEVGISIDGDAPKGQCNLTATMHIYRYAIYRKTIEGTGYFGCSWDDAYYTWHCMYGVVSVKSAHGTSSGPVTIRSNSGTPLGAVCLGTSTPGFNAPMADGRVYMNDDWGPAVNVGPLSYAASCCSISY